MHWKISPEIATSLYKKYDTLFPFNQLDKLGLEHLNDLPGGHKVHAQIFPLSPHSLQTSEGHRANWNAEKGWYDDLVKISKKIRINEGYLQCSDSDLSGNELMDSYSTSIGWENWQQERDCSLALESFTELRSEIHKFHLVVE